MTGQTGSCLVTPLSSQGVGTFHFQVGILWYHLIWNLASLKGCGNSLGWQLWMKAKLPGRLWGFHMLSLGALQRSHLCLQSPGSVFLFCARHWQCLIRSIIRKPKVFPKRYVYSLRFSVGRAGPGQSHGRPTGWRGLWVFSYLQFEREEGTATVCVGKLLHSQV